MKINVSALMKELSGDLPVSFTVNLSEEILWGQAPFQEPIEVLGTVENRAGSLRLLAEVQTTLSTACARCLAPLAVPLCFSAETLLSDNLQNLDADEILPIEDGVVDVGDYFYQLIILHTEGQYVCRPDCKGLCPRCGCDRNRTQCDCEKAEGDPRLAVLKQLLK